MEEITIEDPALPPQFRFEEEQLSTLDESVFTTIWRDLKGVVIKLIHVVLPFLGKSADALRDWDLWGPLLLSHLLELFLSLGRPAYESGSTADAIDTQQTLIFTLVWVIIWVGASLVTINASILGGNLSFFQSICLLGYCLFPLTAAAFILLLWKHIIFRLLIVFAAVIWSSFASLGFIAATVPPNRKVLALYPAVLFYLVLGWIIILQMTEE